MDDLSIHVCDSLARFVARYGDVPAESMLVAVLIIAYKHPEWAGWWGCVLSDYGIQFDGPARDVMELMPVMA